MVLGIIVKDRVYYFRGYVAKELRVYVGKLTVDKSLRTKNKKVALRKVKFLELEFSYYSERLKMSLINKEVMDKKVQGYWADKVKHQKKCYTTYLEIQGRL